MCPHGRPHSGMCPHCLGINGLQREVKMPGCDGYAELDGYVEKGVKMADKPNLNVQLKEFEEWRKTQPFLHAFEGVSLLETIVGAMREAWLACAAAKDWKIAQARIAGRDEVLETLSEELAQDIRDELAQKDSVARNSLDRNRG